MGFTFWYVFFPGDLSTQVFSVQSQTIATINNQMTGQVTSFATGTGILTKIFLNNFKVLIFCILFSFIYGSGAIFILMWNATVIGTALGNLIRSQVAQYALTFHFETVGSYFYIVSMGILRYAIHGIPEIIAYLVAGLAGGIISIAVMRHDLNTERFYHHMIDAADLLLISVGVLAIAAILEVYLTPSAFYDIVILCGYGTWVELAVLEKDLEWHRLGKNN